MLEQENRELNRNMGKLEYDAYERKDTVIISGKAIPSVDKG